MKVPDGLVERAGDMTDDEVLAECRAEGLDDAAARFVLDQLRGRRSPLDELR